MKAGVACKYENVDDTIAATAFEVNPSVLLPTCQPPQHLGLQSWIAKGNVETLKWLREGGFVFCMYMRLVSVCGSLF